MKKEEKTTAVMGLAVILIILGIVAALAVTFLIRKNNSASNSTAGETPEIAAAQYLYKMDTGDDKEKYVISTDGEKMYVDKEPETEYGLILYEGLKDQWSAEVVKTATEMNQAAASVNITCPSTDKMAEAMQEEMVNAITEKAQSTTNVSDIYDDNDEYKSEVLDEAFKLALANVCQQAKEKHSITINSTLSLKKSRKLWRVTNSAVITNTLDEKAQDLFELATTDLEYIPVKHTIDEKATVAPAPDQTKFGETTDPAVVEKLLESKEAKRLIGSQSLVWNKDITFLPDSSIRYYLDESILMIQWQEEESKTVGTFAEVIIADGSQIRRKIAGDTYGDMNFEMASDFGKMTNAVLAVGGDFYNHARNCGIVVYNRDIYRADLATCDVCYIDTNGDMLFSYANQFSDVNEVKTFVEENDILYSISFGPVLIDDGKDVTPSEYTWGEIQDTYARSALGMLGERHYLTMNMNCQLPNNYYLATLRQAADAMVKRGCIKAYTLDGGQTATTVVNGQLVNPVQFGAEKQISDVIYFASAVTN